MKIEDVIATIDSLDIIHAWQRRALLNALNMAAGVVDARQGIFASGQKVEITVVDQFRDVPLTESRIVEEKAAAKSWPAAEFPIPAEDMMTLARLYERVQNAKGPRFIIETNPEDWLQARRLGEAGMVAIEPHALGGVLHITPLGMRTFDAWKGRHAQPDTPKTAEPIAFDYYEIRPCLQVGDGDVMSFTSEEDCAAAEEAILLRDEAFIKTYTLYGRHHDSESGQYLAMAIADFTFKADALQVLNAILAPMAKARDEAREVVDSSRRCATTKDAISCLENGLLDVANDLDDVINQSSNGERL